MITICFTYFRNLSLANLAAALYSVRQQDFSFVKSIVVVDNSTEDSAGAITDIIDLLKFPVPVQFLSFKHGDSSKTHAWSTNVAVRQAHTPWVFFTRADYLLDFNALEKFSEIARTGHDQDVFITSHGCHLQEDVLVCEATAWRQAGPRIFHGVIFDYTSIDSGVWMTQKSTFDAVGGLDERLTAWGHAQTHFQHKLYKAGVEFARIPEVLFYHPLHAGPRDLALAHQQLQDIGVDIRQLWARHDRQMY